MPEGKRRTGGRSIVHLRQARAGRRSLVGSALDTLANVNGYRSFVRTGPLAPLSFSAGLLASELPLHLLATQALRSMPHLARGSLRTPAGKLAAALHLATWPLLVALHREAGRSAQVLDDALADELGTGYRDRIAEHLVPPADVPLTRRQVAFPGLGSRRRYATHRNVAYGPAGKRNTLDVWRRADLPVDGRAPVLVQIHGGAWVVGEKNQQGLPLLTHLAERGWVCLAINYRLSPHATWPDHIADVKRAIAWTREHIAEHGGDPNFIAVTGGSAGGHLASLAGLTAGDPDLQPGFEAADTSVQAVVPFYGAQDLTNRPDTGGQDLVSLWERLVMKVPFDDSSRERWEQASPINRVCADAPPYFVLHGTNDSLIPVEHARVFTRLLREVSTNPVVYAELPRAQHGFDLFNSVRERHAVRATERFLLVAYSDHLSRRVAQGDAGAVDSLIAATTDAATIHAATTDAATTDAATTDAATTATTDAATAAAAGGAAAKTGVAK